LNWFTRDQINIFQAEPLLSPPPPTRCIHAALPLITLDLGSLIAVENKASSWDRILRRLNHHVVGQDQTQVLEGHRGDESYTGTIPFLFKTDEAGEDYSEGKADSVTVLKVR
jgi:hypothetical protein